MAFSSRSATHFAAAAIRGLRGCELSPLARALLGGWTTPRGIYLTLRAHLSGQHRPSTGLEFSEIPGNPLQSAARADFTAPRRQRAPLEDVHERLRAWDFLRTIPKRPSVDPPSEGPIDAYGTCDGQGRQVHGPQCVLDGVLVQLGSLGGIGPPGP